MTPEEKKKIIERIITDSGATSQDEPSGIFMAGLPGAGKTELSRALIEVSGVSPVRIDMDELASLAEGYKPERADEFRLVGTNLLFRLYSTVLKNHLDFIMDGTFSSKNAELNIERALKRGYNLKIVYAYQDPKLAWEFTKAREKVEHRAIRFDGFIETYYKTFDNIKCLSEKYQNSVLLDIVVKDAQNKVKVWHEEVLPAKIDDLIKIEYNKEELIKYIKG